MVCCCRPLSPAELVTALCIEFKNIKSSDVNIAVILKLCNNLVVFDQQLNVLRTAHLSVTEFLEHQGIRVEMDAVAAKTCLSVLVDLVPRRNHSGIQNLHALDLKQYSVLYWTVHMQICTQHKDTDLSKILSQFLGTFDFPGEAFKYWHHEATAAIALLNDEEKQSLRLLDDMQHFDCEPLNPLPAVSLWGAGEIALSVWEAPFDPQFCNKRGEPLLYLSSLCRHGLLEVPCDHEWTLRKLLELGADVNAEGGYSSYALLIAAQTLKVKHCEILLQHGADVNVTGGEWGTALQLAVFNGNERLLELLLEHGAEVNNIYGYYATALQAAAEQNQVGMIQLLLRHGAAQVPGGKWGCPLQAALASSSGEAAAWALIEAGADVNARGGHYGFPLQAAAARRAPLELFDKILDLVDDVNTMDSDSVFGTAVQAASCFERSIPMLDRLLEKGADVNVEGGFYGTAAQAAAYHNCEQALYKHIEHGAKLNTNCGYFGNPLQASCWSGWWGRSGVLYMARRGADINLTGGEYGTALQAAAVTGQTEIVEALLESGADVNIYEPPGAYTSTLQAAISTGHDDIVAMLVDKGARVNPDFDLAAEKSPTHWSHEQKGDGLIISDDGLEATYSGSLMNTLPAQSQFLTLKTATNFVPASVMANHPIPLRDEIFYFEITVIKGPSKAHAKLS